ncbi:hypothetical protein ACFLZZ_04030 [Nanoarchaeota archaeon]
MPLIETIFGIIGLLCFVWVTYDVLAVNKKLKTSLKVLWIVLALFFSIITAIVYFFMYKK